VYVLTSRNETGGGRWVLVVETALAGVSAWATMRERPRAGFGVIAACFLAVVWLGPAFPFPAGQAFSEPVLSGSGTVLAFVVLVLGHVMGLVRWGGPDRHGTARRTVWPWTSGSGIFALAALEEAVGEEPWVLGLALAAVATVLVVSSWAWRGIGGAADASFAVGVFGFLACGVAVATSVFEGETAPWGDVMPVLVGGLLPAGVWLALRWAPVWMRGDEEPSPFLIALSARAARRWSIVAMAGAALLLAARTTWEPPAVHLLPGIAAALAGLVVSEVPVAVRRHAVEVGGVVVLASVQRAVFAETAELSLFWLIQWYVVALGVIALLRYITRHRRVGRIWLAASAAGASLAGLSGAIEADAPQQVWLLLAFVALTIAGLAATERLFTVWGGLGVLACVLWAVRAYPYLLLAALGLALIGATVWWLVRAPRGTLLR
jgi:hypothetical protein